MSRYLRRYTLSMSRGIQSLIVSSFTGAVLVLAVPAYAADCSSLPGTREATASDAVVRDGIIPAGTCFNPNDTGVSNTAAQAKEYLYSIAEGLPGTQAPPTRDKVFMLNDTFAVCAANFIKGYTQSTGVSIKLRSAVRCGPNSPSAWTCDRNENARAGGAVSSNHQLGLAIDINPSDGNYQRLWDAARANSSFGVCFPYLADDRPHLAFAGGTSGEAQKCAAQGIKPTCAGAPAFDPNARPYTPTSIPTSQSAPTGGTNNPFANPYNPTQQQYCLVSNDPIVAVPCSQLSQQIPQPQNSASGYAQSAPTGGSAGSYGTISSNSAHAVGQRFAPDFPLPVPNNTAPYVAPARYTYGSTSAPVPVSTVTNTPTKTLPKSPATLPSRPTPVTQLNPNLQNVVDINETVGYTDSRGLAVNTEANEPVVPGPRITQTFSQPERAVQPTAVAASSSSNTLIVSALTTLRNLLVSYLNILKTRDSTGFRGSWRIPDRSLID
jgi:hypothetical protein